MDPSTNDLFEIAKDGVDKQVAVAVKAAFVRLSTCVCIGYQEFKQILKKIRQNPDLDVKLHR
ncbi:hypothetical protein Hanom_Chr12g01074331 [Helianthus anomalus]